LTRTDLEFTKTLIKITYIGLFLNVILPIGIFAATMVLMNKDFQTGSGFGIHGDANLQIMFYGLLTVSAVDIIATLMIRRRMPEMLLRGKGEMAAARTEKAAINFSVIIFALNLSYTIYGLVLVLMGAEIEVMMLFVALSLIGYQLFRPRQKYLERMLERIEKLE
jgi:hypothetical protein